MALEPAMLDELGFTVLTTVVSKKIATASSVAKATGMSLADVEKELAALEADELVYSAGEHVLPTEEGQDRMTAYADSAYQDLRADEEMIRWHERFDSANRRFLKAITDWQIVPLGAGRTANDHTDARYDSQVLGRIDALVSKVRTLLDQLAEKAPRFARYRERLDAAMERVDQGDTRYVAEPLIDSVHTVWFEFHEDLLLALGKERTE